MSRTAVIVSNAEDSRALCRLCMIYHECFVNIFIPNDTFRICAEEAIHDLLNLKVAVGDGLPSNICHQCAKKLMEFRDFKEMCLKTAEELRKYDLDNVLRVSKIKDEDAADVETSREGSSQENTFPNDIHLTEVFITTPDDLAIGNVSHAKEELWSTENTLVVKEEANDGEHRIESEVPVNALTSVDIDPLAVDMMALKEEAQEPKVAAGKGNNIGDTSPHNHIQVTEVFLPFPDKLAMDCGTVRYAEEDSRPTELIVKEEIGEGLECSENDVPVLSISSVNVDPLAADTTVVHFSQYNQSCVKGGIKSIMMKVLDPEFAKNLNWAGRCLKKGIKQSHLQGVVKGAVGMSQSFKSTPIDALENEIKKWLIFSFRLASSYKKPQAAVRNNPGDGSGDEEGERGF